MSELHLNDVHCCSFGGVVVSLTARCPSCFMTRLMISPLGVHYFTQWNVMLSPTCTRENGTVSIFQRKITKCDTRQWLTVLLQLLYQISCSHGQIYKKWKIDLMDNHEFTKYRSYIQLITYISYIQFITSRSYIQFITYISYIQFIFDIHVLI